MFPIYDQTTACVQYRRRSSSLIKTTSSEELLLDISVEHDRSSEMDIDNSDEESSLSSSPSVSECVTPQVEPIHIDYHVHSDAESNPHAVSLPTFQELLRSIVCPERYPVDILTKNVRRVSLSSSPLSPPSLSVFDQPGATQCWGKTQPAYYKKQAFHFRPSEPLRSPGTRRIQHPLTSSQRNEILHASNTKHILETVIPKPTYQGMQSLPHRPREPLNVPTTERHQPSSLLPLSERSESLLECQHDPEQQDDRNSHNWRDYVEQRITTEGRRAYACLGNPKTGPCSYYDPKKALVKRHIETTHLKQRAYKCTYCPLGFGQKTTLRVHECKKHTFERPFICDFCEECFNDPARLSKHRSSTHGIIAKPRKQKPKLIDL